MPTAAAVVSGDCLRAEKSDGVPMAWRRASGSLSSPVVVIFFINNVFLSRCSSEVVPVCHGFGLSLMSADTFIVKYNFTDITSTS